MMPANRLAHETSPYLLQHAHNPVDWYPWGVEAFERARRENKPIFLSVGYSTCYWCHVMERQSFENDAVAEVMNRLFVNIKVDREERPDVDQLYMTAVQVQTHQGGWPMSVFLTPELEYLYGGTYFPPQDGYGRPGFVTLMNAINDAWQNRRAEVIQSARSFTQTLNQLAIPQQAVDGAAIDIKGVASLIRDSISDFDAVHGGFGNAPKFPRETLLQLLFAAVADDSPLQDAMSSNRSSIETALRGTLDAMMYGGIRDQLGGGFHRYSTDAKWLVPHFEIMLYDNAMLGEVYATASRFFNEPRYASVARGIFDFMLRSMTAPSGGFYTAFDAEVDSREGDPYLWTRDAAEQALTQEPGKGMGAPFSQDEARLFSRVFGLDRGPNLSDPHHGDGKPESNVLFVADAALFNANQSLIRRMSDSLLAERNKRPQPLLDTKIITSWNALMIRALARSASSLSEPRYLAAAVRAAEFILSVHAARDGGLFRVSAANVAKYPGFLDDYAGFAVALLALHEATGELKWSQTARRIVDQMDSRFSDERTGGYFFTDRFADDLLVRQMVGTDSPLPSGNALAATALIGVGEIDRAAAVFHAFGGVVKRQGEAMSSLLEAAILLLQRSAENNKRQGGAGENFSASEESTSDATGLPAILAAAARQTGREITVDLRIADGWHINTDAPPAGLSPTRIVVPGAQIQSVVFPKPTAYHPPSVDVSIPVFAGDCQIRVTLAGDSSPGRILLYFQPCRIDACLAERKLAIMVHD